MTRGVTGYVGTILDPSVVQSVKKYFTAPPT